MYGPKKKFIKFGNDTKHTDNETGGHHLERSCACSTSVDVYNTTILLLNVSIIYTSDLHQTVCAGYLWMWVGPPLAAQRYVMYFRFS